MRRGLDWRKDVPWKRTQKQGSFEEDKKIMKSLLQQAASQRERQRLGRLECEHSGAWVCAVPSTHDGNDSDAARNFQIAVSMRLIRTHRNAQHLYFIRWHQLNLIIFLSRDTNRARLAAVGIKPGPLGLSSVPNRH